MVTTDNIVSQLQTAKDLYTQGLDSTLTDFEYDQLLKQLAQINPSHPLVQQVDSSLTAGSKKVKHELPMLSLDNTYNLEELKKFFDRKAATIVLEEKYDGLSISLRYSKGKLIQAVTRGDGTHGEDVTSNLLRSVSGISTISEVRDVEFRGEVFMTFAELERINKLRAAAELPLYANPRNLAVGTLKSDNLSEPRTLQIVLYYVHGLGPMNQSTQLDLITQLGLPASKASYFTDWSELSNTVQNWSPSTVYPTDGLVLKFDDHWVQHSLGTGRKAPKWAVAYKFAPEQVQTTLLDVTYQIGRTGAITPVAELEPVELDGTTISRCTLHNFDNILSKDIRIGDQVIIEKAGEIIPQVVRSIKEVRTGSEMSISPPTACPVCRAPTSTDSEQGVRLYCSNTACPARLAAQFEYVVSSHCLDTKHIGPALIATIIKSKVVTDPYQLYTLTLEQLQSIEGVGKGVTERVYKSLQTSLKEASADRILASFGIHLIGRTLSARLLERIGSITYLTTATAEELDALEGTVGPAAIKELKDWLSVDSTQLINRLAAAGFNLKYASAARADAGTFCITGTFEAYTRPQLTKILQDLGQIVVTSVGKKVTGVLVGEAAGSKADKAKKLGIPTYDESQLAELFDSLTTNE